MKKLHSSLLVLTLAVAIPAVACAAVVDKILVIVNKEVITQGEVDRIIGPAYEQYKNTLSGEELIRKLDAARQAVIAQLIEEKLILGEAKKLNIQIDEKDVRAKLDEARKRFPSDAIFEQAMAAQHISIRELKTKFKEQLMSRRLIDQKVGSRIFISPTEIVEYYNSHIEDFCQPEQIRLSNILIRPKQNVSIQKTVELVGEVARRLKAGEDFAELAKIYSEGPGAKDGGEMGYVKKGDLLPEIEEVVFDMNEGDVSGIVRTKVGYHFFKVEGRKAAESTSIEDAHRAIEDALWMGKMKEKSKGWLQNLRKHAYIAFK